ncbi:NADP-dependent oxidoreductase [Halioxenophilus sp. WMMB6]|uniref:NADP-dependent oxidoreductase n=1 Tax=Halioxenophilus sp. WMMB6 TaxID=3073815 RepID=UPI00295F2477|nr:NADP-dependent oxidoreductase [Halioxenophilus sp. WMMB6]
MKSTILIAREYGQSAVLAFAESELPSLGAGMARIEVRAAGINPIDARRMTGEFRHAPLPLTFGTEFAGVIVDLPPGTDGWAIGDEVLGSGAGFTHATVIDVPVANLIARPANIAWSVAGSLAGAAQTAMTILQEIGPVSSLLVHGASGGVGSITVQIARELGIDVVATASEGNQAYLQSLGAIPVPYGPGLIDRLAEIHPEPFDASVDMIGNDEATLASLARVKPTGKLGTIAGRPVLSPRVQAIWVKRNPANLAKVVEGVAEGRYQWPVSAQFPFAHAQEAYDSILQGHTRGKSVLIF